MGNSCGVNSAREYTVRVHVYRLMSDAGGSLLTLMESSGFGVFHTGVEVNGKEYAFGASDSGSGVWEQRPTQLPPHFAGATLKESVVVGTCVRTPQELRNTIATLRREWQATSYSLVSRNCNHFSAAMCEALGVSGPPQYVNRLASTGQQVAAVASSAMDILGGFLSAAAGAVGAAAGAANAEVERARYAQQQQQHHHQQQQQQQQNQQQQEEQQRPAMTTNDISAAVGDVD